VVDDESAIRDLVVFFLKDAGYETVEASDGEEGVAKVKEESPDVIVLDVMMPKLDGWGVLSELRRLGLKRNSRVIMLTAKTLESDFLTGWKLGVDDYLTKPFEPEDLIGAIEGALKMSPDEIRTKRMIELEKANLLSRIESAFGEG
jgi:DNA-binding response OmpR family regulator